MRYSVCLSYNGASFCGWQTQPSAPSVQAALEGALSRLLGGAVPVTGAGRTDTAVNAVNYIAHFDFSGPLPFETADFIYKLNAILPRSVVVHEVLPVADDFHARFSARRREYTYFIHRHKDPFVAPWSWQCGYPELDFDAMNAACQLLLGTHDFSCFEKTGTDNKTSVCTVFDAFWKPYTPSHIQVMGLSEVGSTPWGACPPPDKGRGRGPQDDGTGSKLAGSPERQTVGGAGVERSETESPQGVLPTSEPQYWYFRIAADRFLRNMVRATVGSLIEVGRGKHRPEWIAELIESGTRGDAGESVPGNALFLNKVQY
ncbi:MAG: tRNA pseudouridine synthase A [Bacteroidales bacterium]|nr:tRNA pseudouridine synthase A [Bacteroidales bacterium]